MVSIFERIYVYYIYNIYYIILLYIYLYPAMKLAVLLHPSCEQLGKPVGS